MKKEALISYILQIISVGLTFLVNIIVTRYLNLEERGQYVLMTNALGFVVIFLGLSINSTIPYYINSLKISINRVYSTTLIWVIISTVLLLAITAVLNLRGLHSIYIPSKNYFFYFVFIILYVLQLNFTILSSILNSIQKIRQNNFINIIMLGFSLLIVLFFYLFAPNYFKSRIYLPISALVFIYFIGNYIAWKNIPDLQLGSFKAEFIEKKNLKDFFKNSILVYLSNLATFLCYKFDFWIVDKYCGKSSLAIYSLSAQLAQMFWVLPQALANVLYAFATQMNLNDCKKASIQFLQIGVILNFLFISCSLIFLKFFIPFLFGEQYITAYSLFVYLAPGIFLFTIPSILSSFYASVGNFKFSFYNSVIVSILAIILYYIFIKSHGIIGGAIASSVVYSIGAINSFIYFKFKYQIQIAEFFTPIQFNIKKYFYK